MKNAEKVESSTSTKHSLIYLHGTLFNAIEQGDENKLIATLNYIKHKKIKLSQVFFCALDNVPRVKKSILHIEQSYDFNSEINEITGDENKQSLLIWAVKNRRSNIVRILVTYGAQVNYKTYYAYPLHVSAELGYTEIAALLLQLGANIESLNAAQETPLHVAALRGHEDTVKLLVENNANINAISARHLQHTPLRCAIASGKLEIVEFLLSKGIDVNQSCDYIGCKPIHVAASKGKIEIFKLLLKFGADPTLTSFRNIELVDWLNCVNGPDENSKKEIYKAVFKHTIYQSIQNEATTSGKNILSILKEIKIGFIKHVADIFHNFFKNADDRSISRDDLLKLIIRSYKETFQEYYVKELNREFYTNYKADTLFFRCLNVVSTQDIQKNIVLPYELGKAIAFLKKC